MMLHCFLPERWDSRPKAATMWYDCLKQFRFSCAEHPELRVAPILNSTSNFQLFWPILWTSIFVWTHLKQGFQMHSVLHLVRTAQNHQIPKPLHLKTLLLPNQPCNKPQLIQLLGSNICPMCRTCEEWQRPWWSTEARGVAKLKLWCVVLCTAWKLGSNVRWCKTRT